MNDRKKLKSAPLPEAKGKIEDIQPLALLLPPQKDYYIYYYYIYILL